ncbi:hypothetical protein ANDA3_1575 [plant metagenome]|uniref:Uncharacterized protein n=2 Tax=root TaxID=1 RepID=A0A1C3K868_9BURK|nr:hypothetical protein ODI_00686 [Orrella dioscoreae]SOE48530.1 hypothetical protein ODI_R1494 [Orrella dioscoreae]
MGPLCPTNRRRPAANAGHEARGAEYRHASISSVRACIHNYQNS